MEINKECGGVLEIVIECWNILGSAAECFSAAECSGVVVTMAYKIPTFPMNWFDRETRL